MSTFADDVNRFTVAKGSALLWLLRGLWFLCRVAAKIVLGVLFVAAGLVLMAIGLALRAVVEVLDDAHSLWGPPPADPRPDGPVKRWLKRKFP